MKKYNMNTAKYGDVYSDVRDSLRVHIVRKSGRLFSATKEVDDAAEDRRYFLECAERCGGCENAMEDADSFIYNVFDDDSNALDGDPYNGWVKANKDLVSDLYYDIRIKYKLPLVHFEQLLMALYQKEEK